MPTTGILFVFYSVDNHAHVSDLCVEWDVKPSSLSLMSLVVGHLGTCPLNFQQPIFSVDASDSSLMLDYMCANINFDIIISIIIISSFQSCTKSDSNSVWLPLEVHCILHHCVYDT